MAVATETVAVKYLSVTANVEIAVPIPVYRPEEIVVLYGDAGLIAVQNTDYTYVMLDANNFYTIKITPKPSLLAKIDALMALDVNQENFIVVRRVLNYKTSSTPAYVKDTTFVSFEFDRTAMRFQQISEEFDRTIKLAPSFVGGGVTITQLVPGAALVVDPTGTQLIAGPTADQIVAAQQYAEDAQQSAVEAQEVVDSLAGAVSAFVIGGYGVFLPDTRLWLKYLYDNGLEEPRRYVAFAYDDFIAELTDCGAWAITDWFNVFFSYNEAVSLVSVKNQGFITWTPTAGPAFEPGVGYKGTGVNTTGPYLLANKSPSEMVHFTQNAAGAGELVSGADPVAGKNSFATLAGAATPGFGMTSWNGAGNQNVRINGSTLLAAPSPGTDGFVMGVRESATSLKSYRDQALVGSSGANNSIVRSASPFTLLTSSTVRSDDFMHAALAGGLYTADMVAGIHSALSTLRATIGAF